MFSKAGPYLSKPEDTNKPKVIPNKYRLRNKNAKGQIINIGSGKSRKIKNIIEYVKKILKGGYPLFGKVKLRKDEILKVYPDINKAKNKINWRPKISFKKGLKVTIDSFK